MQQLYLLGPANKPLDKIPFKFYIEFNCGHENCGTHNKSIEDWELGVLYRKVRASTGSPAAAAKTVCSKLMEERFRPNRDVHLFVGTESSHQSWLVVGTFCPPRPKDTGDKQPGLALE